jgi:hypothetical protein
VESPELGSIDKAALLSGGEFLLRFDDCQLPIGVLDTQFPGRYVSNNVPYLQVPGAPSDPQDGPEFALALTTGKVDQAAIGILGVACGSATTSCREDVRVALELQAPNGGSYVVTFRATSHFWSGTVQELEVSIGGADGTLSCTYSAKERTVNCGG